MMTDSPGQSNEKLFPFWVLTAPKVDELGPRWTTLWRPLCPPAQPKSDIEISAVIFRSAPLAIALPGDVKIGVAVRGRINPKPKGKEGH
jgi:hypothetical protein